MLMPDTTMSGGSPNVPCTPGAHDERRRRLDTEHLRRAPATAPMEEMAVLLHAGERLARPLLSHSWARRRSPPGRRPRHASARARTPGCRRRRRWSRHTIIDPGDAIEIPDLDVRGEAFISSLPPVPRPRPRDVQNASRGSEPERRHRSLDLGERPVAIPAVNESPAPRSSDRGPGRGSRSPVRRTMRAGLSAREQTTACCRSRRASPSRLPALTMNRPSRIRVHECLVTDLHDRCATCDRSRSGSPERSTTTTRPFATRSALRRR